MTTDHEHGRPSADRTATLQQYMQPLLAHQKLIAVVTVATLVVGTVAGLAAPTTYRSGASILVTPISGDPTKALESGDVKVDMPTELRIATSQAVINAVGGNLEAGSITVSPETLAGSVTATSPKESRILDYAFEAPTPELAQIGADTFAETYLAYRTGLAIDNQEAAKEAINQRIGLLKERLSEVEAGLARSPRGSQDFINFTVEKTSVEGELSALQTALADLSTLTIDAGEIIDQARLPESPEGLNLLQIIAGSLVGGLVLGAMAAYAYSALSWSRRRDRRATDSQTLEEHTVTPNQTLDERTVMPSQTLDERSAPAVLAGFDELIDRLRHLGASSPVTGLCVGDHDVAALSVAFDLAEALQRIGARVLLIDAVAHSPLLHTLLGVDAGPGLVELLDGGSALEAVAHPVDELAGVDAVTFGSLGHDRTGIDLVGAGMGGLLVTARRRYHAVLIVAGALDQTQRGDTDRRGAVPEAVRQFGDLADGMVVGTEQEAGTRLDADVDRRLQSIAAPVLGVISVNYAVDDDRAVASDVA